MRLVIGFAMAVIVTGCDRTETASAGTPIWTLVEDQRIGSVDDDSKGFTRIERLLMTRDRQLLISDDRVALRVVDSTGRFLRPIGQRGGGPGEYERIDAFGLIGDTVWVFDERWHRITLFNRSGSTLGTVPFRAPEISGWRTPEYPGTLMGDASVVVAYRRELLPDCMPDARMLVRLERPRADLAPQPQRVGGPCGEPGRVPTAALVVRDTLTTMSLQNYQVYTPVNMPGRSKPFRVLFTQPLADQPLWRPAHDGMTMVFVERRAATSADSASFSVTKLVFGDTTIARRYQYTPVPAPDALIDSILANTEEGRYGMAREAVYHPQFRPPVTDAIVGIDGSVWLKRESSYGPTARWTVIHPGGEIVGEVHVPSSHELRAADADYVWTTITDENDVPFIVRNRIMKSGPTR
jgi:hypothetical protein